MEGWLPIFYLMVILKIPVGLLLYIVWWAFKAEPVPEEAPETGADGHGFRRFRGGPKRPSGPRRGPHAPDALPLPDCPPGRMRIGAPAAIRAGAGSLRPGQAERASSA